MRSKIISISLIFVFFALIFVGCKKGENDPALSLLSRKARLTGIWNLTDANYTIKNNNNNTTVYSYDGDSELMTETFTGNNNSGTETYTYSKILTINKDNSYNDLETIVNGGTSTFETEGFWYFAPSNDELDVKNKERVVFEITKITHTSDNDNNWFDSYSGATNSRVDVFLLDQLSNKQITVLFDYTATDDDGLVYSISGSAVFSQE
ncbi:MAG: hypothetical protein JXL97_00755 [Bacteroidales bacterium]|nr:hypothetical protein [Bacteroidales bacterium]